MINSLSANLGLPAAHVDVPIVDYVDPGLEWKEGYRDRTALFCRKSSPGTIYKSHHAYEYLSEELGRFRTIYVVRDPRDVIVSMFFYFRSVGVQAFPRPSSVEEFALRTRPYEWPFDGAYSWIRSEDFVDRWIAHVRPWSSDGRVLMVRYTDLKRRFVDVMKRVSSFLDRQLTGVRVPGLWEGNPVLPRKGIVGDWANHMTKECSDEIVRRVGEVGLGGLLSI